VTDSASDPSPLELQYGCDVSGLPAHLQTRFVELEPDESTRRYLAEAPNRRAGWALTTCHWLCCQVMSDFDANGWLGIYPMHLLGTAQWQRLLGEHPGGRLLDVGAGSGDVTAELAGLFDQVTATETSRGMVWRLRRRGLDGRLTDVSVEGVPDPPYAAISCLNVLDRCSRPISLLRRLRAGLAEDGRLIISLPLPFTPFVYRGPLVSDPDEALPCEAPSFERGVLALVAQGLVPLGLSVEAWTRAPYLSGGDARRAAYVLDAVIIVCRHEAASPSGAGEP
jgi:SAM-dependent methyltransferase